MEPRRRRTTPVITAVTALSAVAAALAAVPAAASAAPTSATKLAVRLSTTTTADPVTGVPATFSVSVSLPKGDSVTSATLNYGDGTKATTGKPKAKISHTFAKAGNYTLSVSVTDAKHKHASAKLHVTVDSALVNLLQNPGAESSAAASDDGTTDAPAGWTTTGDFTAVQYGTSGFPDADASKAITGGKAFFAGGVGVSGAVSTASQRVDVSSQSAAIDAGARTATLAADLGGYADQDDYMTITASFFDAGGGSLGTLTIGPVTAAQRDSNTKLLPVKATGTVPTGTRSVTVLMASYREDGTYIDGYADNVLLAVR